MDRLVFNPSYKSGGSGETRRYRLSLLPDILPEFHIQIYRECIFGSAIAGSEQFLCHGRSCSGIIGDIHPDQDRTGIAAACGSGVLCFAAVGVSFGIPCDVL